MALLGAAVQASASDRQAALNRLQENQSAIDAAMVRLGAPRRSWAGEGTDKAADGKVDPLFRVHGTLRQARLPVGTILYGTILNRLVVGSDGSPVIIRLNDSQGSVSGLRVIGNARQAGTPGRVAVEFKQLVTSNGQALALQAVGLDGAGAVGMPAEVFSSKALAMVGSMAASFVSGLAAGSQSQAMNGFGFSQVQPTGRNALLQGVAQTAADQSKRLIEEATAEKPILVVSEETPIAVLVQEEVRL
ncbi:MAG: TrbI/VirB10 family protein [Bdellovibrionales bacterium]|nr:TrbI/VirB10 family protein [Bdellovibrionales bacterium]